MGQEDVMHDREQMKRCKKKKKKGLRSRKDVKNEGEKAPEPCQSSKSRESAAL